MTRDKELLESVNVGFFKEFPTYFTRLDEERAEGYMEITDKALNPHGMAHGGVTFAFGDNLSGVLGSLKRPTVTVNAQVDYFHPVDAGRVEGQAYFLKSGKTLSTVRVEISQNGQLCIQGTYTMMHLDKDKFKE